MLDFEPWTTEGVLEGATGRTRTQPIIVEPRLSQVWDHIRAFAFEPSCVSDWPSRSRPKNPKEDLAALARDVQVIRKALEKLRMPGSTTLKPEDEPTMFHENMLLSCYTKLEALRMLNKLVDLLCEKVENPKSTHSLKTKLSKKDITDLANEVKICYEAIRDLAQSYITLIKTKGSVAIKAQVRWGFSGKLLAKLIEDDSLDIYAKEYVDSALEAWNGVLKVKLK